MSLSCAPTLNSRFFQNLMSSNMKGSLDYDKKNKKINWCTILKTKPKKKDYHKSELGSI